VTLDDSAATFASNQCNAAAVPSIKGTFKPSQPLSKFFREPLAGTWRLQIDDAENVGPGNLFRWCLQAQKSSVAPDRIFANAFEAP
jgi:subtilisin-like proprotein convertase family protein